MANCRIQPTLNGLPHLGHAYLALLNEHAAHSTGGKLTLIYDDAQQQWIDSVGLKQMDEYAVNWVDDMEWLGIHFDAVISMRQYGAEFHKWFQMYQPAFDTDEDFPEMVFPEVVGEPTQYPYWPYVTAEKVYFDSMADVTHVIRGFDLRSEFWGYIYYWRKFVGGRPPKHQYIPRLLSNESEIDTVSKTVGTFKIATLREKGCKPKDILNYLRLSCLVDPAGEWTFENVKPHPQMIVKDGFF